MADKFSIDPWEVSGKIDYERLVKEFGLNSISADISNKLSSLHPLLRRGTYYAHRDFDKWLEAAQKGKEVSILTGRGPSEKMHLGHLVPFLVALSLQKKFDCEVYIPISDDEKFFVKPNLTYAKSIEYARDNILDLIALGFRPNKTFIFEDFVYTKIYSYAAQIAKKITYSTAKAAFGLTNEKNIGWTFYPAVQAAHILFPQFRKGKHHTLVPIGIDQDPFIRLTRDIANHSDFNFEKPAAIHAKFIPSLTGNGKMSSSDDKVIYLSDSAKEVEKKINKYAFSGGKDTLEEHRKHGGNPEIDVSYQYLSIFFEEDEEKLRKIHDEYKSGNLLSGELKKIAIKNINEFLKEHQKRKKEAERMFDKFILKD